MEMKTKRAVLTLSLGFLAAGCASTRDFVATDVFRLVEVGGDALPVSYPEEEGCSEEVISATLALDGEGAWEMTMNKREICGEVVEEDEDVERGTYTVAGATYRFTGPAGGAPQPGEVEIEDLGEGTLEDDVLTARLGDGTTVVFRRQ